MTGIFVAKNLLSTLFTSGLLLAVAALPARAVAVVLDFNKSVLDTFVPYTIVPGIVNYFSLPQAYGDILGRVDVQYSSVNGLGSSVACVDPLMYFWDNNYSHLSDVAFGCPGGAAQISLIPAAGYQVTLRGFDLGSWPNLDRSTQFAVYNSDLSVLIDSDLTVAVSGAMATQYAFLGPQYTRRDGLQIQFGPDANNVGIDNIRFDVSPVPGPVPLLGIGAAYGWSRKIRRRLQSPSD